MDMRHFAIRNRWKSFGYALNGIRFVLTTQPNSWIMMAAVPCVLVAGFVFRVTRIEWCFLVVAMILPFIAELMNTAVESLTDLVIAEVHPLAKRAKDTAAGAVLLSSVLAFLIGLLVFGPRLFVLIWKFAT